jgi:adenylate cyclase
MAAATSIAQPLVAPRMSIVVLPFANLSNDPEQQYFVDGITDDLTTDLSRISDMLVISRNSAFTYKDKPVGTRQIGRELGVRYVLDGTAQRTGNKLRVNAQLIDAEATYIYGSSGSTATREISSPCKTRSQAGSQSPSTLH